MFVRQGGNMPYYNIDNGRYYTDSSCTTECDSKGNVVGEKLISAILAPIVLLIFLSYFFVPLFSIFLIYLFRDFSVYRHRVIYLSSIILASVIEILNVFFKYSGFIASLDSIKSLIIILSLFVCCYMFIQEKEYKSMDVIIDIAILLLPILDVVCKAIPYWIMNSVSDLSFAAFEINIDLLKNNVYQCLLPLVAYIVMMAGAKVMKSKDINNLTMKNAVVLIILYVLVGTFFIYYGNEIRNFINKGGECGRFPRLNYKARPSSVLYSFGLLLFKPIFILSFLNQLRYLSMKYMKSSRVQPFQSLP